MLSKYELIFNLITSGIDDIGSLLSVFIGNLDSLGRAYNTLSSAVDEFNEYGDISASTLKALYENDLLQYLESTETGLRINTSALEAQAEAARIAAIQTLQDAAAQDILALSTGEVDRLSNIAKQAIAIVGDNAATAGNQAETAAGQIAGMAVALFCWRRSISKF